MCTGIPVYAGGNHIFARTMEFTEKMDSQLYVVPKHNQMEAVYTPPPARSGDQPGADIRCKKWTVDYAFIGPNYLETDQVIEGFNEKGLHVAGFYFPGYENDYQPFQADGDTTECGNTVTQLSFASWVLSQCHSVANVIEKVKDVRVCGSFFNKLGKVPGIHWIVQDNSGECMVFEFLNQKLNILDNPYGVITNAPEFNWHKTNLSNYINLSAKNSEPYIPRKPNGERAEAGFTVAGLGQGSGMLGIPGDFTSPSRFIRAVLLSQTADIVATNSEGVTLAWNMVNNVDIAFGTIQFSDAEKAVLSESQVEDIDYTQWVSVSDLGSQDYYYRTYDNQNIRVVSLPQVIAEARKLAGLPDQQQDNEKPAPIMRIPMCNSKAIYYNAGKDAEALST